MLRIVFMGSDAIALPALNWLKGKGSGVAQLVGVFTQPDRAAGRGQKVAPNAIKIWATTHGLPVLQPAGFGPADQRKLAELKPDLTLVMAYGHILAQEVIDTPRLGTLNLHTSLLPKYRGASPIQAAITSADPETGVSLMKLVFKLDAGPVADVERVKVGPLDTATMVEAGLALACVPLLTRCLPKIAAGRQDFTAQNDSHASYCRRLTKKDGVLDFRQPASILAGRINGLMPWPGCTVELGDQVVKLGLADALPGSGLEGEVTGSDSEGLLVGTGRGLLRLRQLQRSGGKMLPAADFLRGFPVTVGTRLPSRPMPPLVAREPFPRKKG